MPITRSAYYSVPQQPPQESFHQPPFAQSLPASTTRLPVIRSLALAATLFLAACGGDETAEQTASRDVATGRGAAQTQDGAPELPQQLAWTAYNLGTTGYNQAVAIGAMLRDQYNITLRVIPGQNDVSRLLPLNTGRVQFSANGVATYFAQEGVFQFADAEWGPQALRMLMSSSGLSNQSVAAAADSGIRTFEDMRGRRVPFVRAAPALNISMEALMACGGITWDDVVRVDFPGYDAMWTGVIEGQVDVAFGTTVSGPARRLEASPRGIVWLPTPHDDEDCIQRVLEVGPYFTRHMATRGPGISDENPQEGMTYPYPVLISLASQDENTVYWMTRLINENYDRFKDADPGAIGWALERQTFDWVVPYHEGAVRYWREIGIWTDELEAHNQSLLQRQQVLAAAWQDVEGRNIRNAEERNQTWMETRARYLEDAGFNPVWR